MPFSSNFEDFFNMDLLSNPGGSSSSRSSSRSPGGAFSPLPPTPPQPVLISGEHDSLFNFQLEDDFLKNDPLATMSSAPYDFLGAFDTLHSNSPESNSATSGMAESPSYQFAIDPQLVGTPVQPMAQSEFDEDEGRGDDEDDDDLALPPAKVGGKGMARKGTVQTGGVVKKSGMTAKEKKENQDKEDADDWRPSPEEYQKMSSKEKRQLRNKISARNFRVRRKEYIHTLEGDIAERDRLIDAIRSELGSTKSENNALRQEVASLKKAMLEGRLSPMLPPPAPLSPFSPATRTTTPILTPNTQKDLPTSPRLASRAFWGGSQSFGGITPVHTTLIPDFSVSPILSGKPAPSKRSPSQLLENMNPSLNVNLPLSSAHSANNLAGFDAFTEMNPFTLKTLDAYRMQLWGKMAVQHHQREHLSTKKPQDGPQLTGLASGLRPHYFTSKSSQPLSALLSGKSLASSSSSAYPSPPSSPASRNSNLAASGIQTPSPQHAMMAALASQTLLQKMGQAFWDAFSRSSAGAATASPSASAPRHASWDADKVRRVLEGKAVLRVVDVEPVPPKVSPSTQSAADALEESMRTLSLGASAPAVKTEEKECCFFPKLRAAPPVGSIAVKK